MDFFISVRKSALLVVLLLISLSAFSQRYLVLKRRNHVLHQFAPGDDISFKLKGEKVFNNGLIIGFSDNSIKLHYNEISFDEIEKIKLPYRDSHFISLFSGLAVTGGVLFIGLDQANQLLVQGNGLGPSEETLMISGGLIGTGLLLQLFVKKKFKITGRKYRLEATDFNYAK
ncbi:hypothetical protein E1176_14280 [Fulvivirga sp. RKSG066]|uniref:hypothetical protein n=1 Tax=Fulvivirga aurantia TaxID=2529383 RepID=UPI0012BCF6FC|nr:hypothetical protein [Fulvivirga aurantia]MTI22195.1 hypothetical protein [Fulvivirga aurantia]